MSIPTRVSLGIRRWTCPICHYCERISTKRHHLQTNQPLTPEQQIATLSALAEKHWRECHRKLTLGGARVKQKGEQ